MKPTMGTLLKDLRIARDLSQDQVAKMVGVTGSAISQYESDIRQPPYDILVSLARVYHASTDYILGIENRRSINVSGLTEPEIEAIMALVTIMTEKNKLISKI